MNEATIDPQPWKAIQKHLEEAVVLLAAVRKKHEAALNFKQYSKLHVVERTVEKFTADVAEVFQGLMRGPTAAE